MSQCVHESSTDLPFVLCYEEVDYELLLGSIVGENRALESAPFQMGLQMLFGVSVHMNSCTSFSTGHSVQRRRISNIRNGVVSVAVICPGDTMSNSGPCRGVCGKYHVKISSK